MSNLPERWRKGLRPDPEVLHLVDVVREAIIKGQVRGIAIVTIDPQLDVEICLAGCDDLVRKRLLAAGCMEVAHKVLRKPTTP